MRKPAPTLAFASLLLLAAPSLAQSKNIHEQTDPYTKLKTLLLEVSTRTCPDDPPMQEHDPDVHIIFSANQNPDGTVAYFIVPELDRGIALNVRPKGTLDTLIDGAVETFSTPLGSTAATNFSYDRAYIHETIPYVVSQNDIATIAAANTFQFRVNGPRQAVQRCTDARRLRDLPEFLAAAELYGSPQITSVLPPPPPVESPDPLTQAKNLKITGIATVACPTDPPLTSQDPDIHLSISAAHHGGGLWYFISTEVTSGPPLKLNRGDALITQVDGKPWTFHTINGSILSSSPDAHGNDISHETTAFHLHERNLLDISKAALVDIRINTPNVSIHRCVQADQFKELPQFLSAAANYEAQHLAALAQAPAK